MKYFESNYYVGDSPVELHHFLLKTTQVVAGNLFFNQTKDDVSEEHRRNLAASALMMIAVCEAIVDTVPEEDAKVAFEEIRGMVSDEGDEHEDEPSEKALSLLVKILGL